MFRFASTRPEIGCDNVLSKCSTFVSEIIVRPPRRLTLRFVSRLLIVNDKLGPSQIIPKGIYQRVVLISYMGHHSRRKQERNSRHIAPESVHYWTPS